MSGLSRRRVLRALQDELPKPVKECEKSVMEDNPDMDRSTAIAICRDQLDMSERQELAEQYDLPRILDESNPCWEGYTMVGFKTDENGNEVPNCVPDDDVPDANLGECPDGQMSINGDCVPVEQVNDVPPSALEQSAEGYDTPLLLTEGDVGAIERVEQEDGTVRYTNIKLLAPGKWTDQASGETIHYSPEGIENMDVTDDARVNLMHDVTEAGEPNPPSDVGRIDAASTTTDAEGNLYADIVLEMDSPGSEYADENLQTALESGGEVGAGGPSVEIPAEGQRLEWDNETSVYELKEGKISGAGIVWNPASKDVDFSKETATREIAMALSGDSDKAMYLQRDGMSDDNRTLADAETVREVLESNGIDTGEMSDEEMMAVGEELMDEYDMDGGGEDSEEGEEMGDYEDDEEEEEEEDDDMEMMDDGAIDVLEEQIDDLWGEIDKLKEEMGGMEEDMENAREQLADADTVEEVAARLEELDKNLASGRTLAEGKDADTEDRWQDWAAADGQPDADTNAL